MLKSTFFLLTSPFFLQRYDGSERRPLKRHLADPLSVVVAACRVPWSDMHSWRLHWAEMRYPGLQFVQRVGQIAAGRDVRPLLRLATIGPERYAKLRLLRAQSRCPSLGCADLCLHSSERGEEWGCGTGRRPMSAPVCRRLPVRLRRRLRLPVAGRGVRRRGALRRPRRQMQRLRDGLQRAHLRAALPCRAHGARLRLPGRLPAACRRQDVPRPATWTSAPCRQLCRNTKGGFRSGYLSGYGLEPDGVAGRATTSPLLPPTQASRVGADSVRHKNLQLVYRNANTTPAFSHSH
jgi:hypothetical protein